MKLTLSVNLNIALIMGKIEEREKIQQRTSNAATCAFKVQGRDMEKIKDTEKVNCKRQIVPLPMYL